MSEENTYTAPSLGHWVPGDSAGLASSKQTGQRRESELTGTLRNQKTPSTYRKSSASIQIFGPERAAQVGG